MPSAKKQAMVKRWGQPVLDNKLLAALFKMVCTSWIGFYVGWEELLDKSPCLNFRSYLYTEDVELSKEILKKSKITTAHLSHEKSQSLESFTVEDPLKCFLLDSGCHGSAQIKMIQRRFWGKKWFCCFLRHFILTPWFCSSAGLGDCIDYGEDI